MGIGAYSHRTTEALGIERTSGDNLVLHNFTKLGQLIQDTEQLHTFRISKHRDFHDLSGQSGQVNNHHYRTFFLLHLSRIFCFSVCAYHLSAFSGYH